jgi:hypothetical protein
MPHKTSGMWLKSQSLTKHHGCGLKSQIISVSTKCLTKHRWGGLKSHLPSEWADGCDTLLFSACLWRNFMLKNACTQRHVHNYQQIKSATATLTSSFAKRRQFTLHTELGRCYLETQTLSLYWGSHTLQLAPPFIIFHDGPPLHQNKLK